MAFRWLVVFEMLVIIEDATRSVTYFSPIWIDGLCVDLISGVWRLDASR